MGFAAVSAFYWSVTLLPLSDVASLGFLSPLGVALAAPCLLGEPASRAALAAVPVALVGVALVAQPTFLFGDGAALPAAGIAVGLLQVCACSPPDAWLLALAEPSPACPASFR
jgi:drug/metabolite transporter (DMT)-like permease